MQTLDFRHILPAAQADSETQVAITCLDTAATTDGVVEVMQAQPRHTPVADWRGRLIHDSARPLWLVPGLQPPAGAWGDHR